MRAVVVGAGEVGFHVAERLAREKNEIVVIDSVPERLDYVEAHIDVGIVEGHGASPTVLHKAGIAKAELLVAVTSIDEVNLVCCTAARGRSDMVKVARVSNPDFYSGSETMYPGRFDVDVMINPERELALDTFRLLQSTVASDIAVFAGGDLQVISIPITDTAPVAGRSLAAIAADVGDEPILTAAIQRNGATLVPSGSTVIQPGDQAYIVAVSGAVPRALELCGHEHAALKRVIIAGGSLEAYYLGQLLAQHRVHATILVDDRTRAVEFAEKLDKALILKGDATDIELLEVEGVGDADAFLALTDEDQTNILSSLVAKHSGAKQVITLVNNIHYVSLARRIGIDAAVSPRLSAANAIMGHVHRGSVTRVSAFKDTDAEAISFVVSARCPVINQPLAELSFPDGTIVAAIERDGVLLVPRGRDSLKPGDLAVVFALPDAVGAVTKLFPMD